MVIPDDGIDNCVSVEDGDRIRIIKMDDCNGKDLSVQRMNGQEYTVKFVDDIGQIHLEEIGLSVIPDVDEFEIIKGS